MVWVVIIADFPLVEFPPRYQYNPYYWRRSMVTVKLGRIKLGILRLLLVLLGGIIENQNSDFVKAKSSISFMP